MKSKIHIATKEYCFIEIEHEDNDDFENTAQQVVGAHGYLLNLLNDKEGLPQKEWNKVLDTYLNRGGMDPEEHEEMSKAQKYVIKELDKAFNRIRSKE